MNAEATIPTPSMINVRKAAQVVATISTTNQMHPILNHLIMKGSISPLEADSLYRVKRLTSRIHDLKKLGVNITGEFRRDLTGKRYVRYYIAG
jgi:hypothetical protein